MNLFSKLAASISFLLIVAMSCLGTTIYWAEQRTIRQQDRREQDALLTTLVHIVRESILTNDDLLLINYVRWLRKWTPTMTSASVVDVDGDVLAHSEPNQIGQTLTAETRLASPAFVLSAPIHLGSTWHGTASIAFSQERTESRIQDRLKELKQRLLQVMAWSLPLGLSVSFWVAISWTSPIKAFVQLTQEVGQGRWAVGLSPWTERKDELGGLARSFEHMTDQLRQLDQLKDDFVSAVTHELRSPLGAIESYLNVIALELPEGISMATWENYLHRLRANTHRLNRFVNDLLDVAALERGKVKLERQAVEIVPLAQDVMGLFALSLKDKGLSYEVVAPSFLKPAYADPEKIRQVLVNLVSNAIKFTPSGGHVSITINPRLTPGEQLISVTDTGRGISAADQESIFDKFQQIDSARKQIQGNKGTGLGLSICKSLVELHGQILRVSSRLGQGSVFFFTLPEMSDSLKGPS